MRSGTETLYKTEYALIRSISKVAERGVLAPFGSVSKAALGSWYMRHHEFTGWTDTTRGVEFYTLLMTRFPDVYYGNLFKSIGEK